MVHRSITPYLKHTVSIVFVTQSKGSRTTSTTTGIAAFVFERLKAKREGYGDQESTETVVFLEPDQTISEIDEIIVDGIQRPIVEIHKPKDLSVTRFQAVVLK